MVNSSSPTTRRKDLVDCVTSPPQQPLPSFLLDKHLCNSRNRLAPPLVQTWSQPQRTKISMSSKRKRLKTTIKVTTVDATITLLDRMFIKKSSLASTLKTKLLLISRRPCKVLRWHAKDRSGSNRLREPTRPVTTVYITAATNVEVSESHPMRSNPSGPLSSSSPSKDRTSCSLWLLVLLELWRQLDRCISSTWPSRRLECSVSGRFQPSKAPGKKLQSLTMISSKRLPGRRKLTFSSLMRPLQLSCAPQRLSTLGMYASRSSRTYCSSTKETRRAQRTCLISKQSQKLPYLITPLSMTTQSKVLVN